MKVFQGPGTSNPVTLTQSNYVAAGGEGAVYVKGSTGFKIYHDPKKMLPVGKIQELSVITDPRVNRPRDVLFDPSGTPVGYTMEFYKDCIALCQLFPRDFRTRNQITSGLIESLVLKLRESVANVHKAGVLIVDLNEMNFLVTKGFQDLRCIDVDSWQTPHYHASAIMSSVRDWSRKTATFDKSTDWFSFAVVTFQMFCGIHPYRGKYKGPEDKFRAKLPTDDPADDFAVTRRRMEAGVSVFHPMVGVPGAAYPVDVIPPTWRDWYDAVLSRGLRAMPPTDFGAPFVFVQPVSTVLAADHVDITEEFDMRHMILGLYCTPAGELVATTIAPAPSMASYTQSYDLRSTRNQELRSSSLTVPLDGPVLLPKSQRPAMVCTTKDGVEVTTTRQAGRALATPTATMVYDGRLYGQVGSGVYEFSLTEVAGDGILLSMVPVAQVMENATQLFPGAIIQSMLGATYVSLLVASKTAMQVRIPELDAYRVVDAKYERGILMVIAVKNGRFDRLVFKFDAAGTFELRVVPDVAVHELNFAVLDSKICVCITEDEELEVFSTVLGRNQLKIVHDAAISGDMRLVAHAGGLYFARGTKIYRLKMK